MGINLLVFAILVPALFWAAYHWYHDRHRPEPVANLLAALLLGVGAAYLNQGMYAALGVLGLRFDALALAASNLPGLFAYAVLGIGLTEELAKLLPFLLVVLRFRDFDEAGDGIVYASFLALGFSIVENLHFLQFVTPLEGVARGFAGPVVHMAFASVWGYQVGLAHYEGRSAWRAAALWLGVTALLHGLYDFVVLGFPSPALMASAGLVLAIWLWRLQVVWRLHEAP